MDKTKSCKTDGGNDGRNSDAELRSKDGRTVAEIRRDFPMLQRQEAADTKPLVYFNNSATSLKPEVVLLAMEQYYREYGVNISRGIAGINHEASEQYGKVRAEVARFISAPSADSIVFTYNTTSALNLVAYSYGRAFVTAGDEIMVTDNEHHANFVPWQQIAKEKGAKFTVLKTNRNGALEPEVLERALAESEYCTKIVSVFHISNVMGAENDLKRLAAVAHAAGAVIAVDGAQGIVHRRVDVTVSDVDFYAFSGHKILGPTGVGVLYGKPQLLEIMPPFLYGGEMINIVEDDETSFALPPQRFEAGTMPIAEVVGLGAALCYVDSIGYDFIEAQTEALVNKIQKGLRDTGFMEIYNPENIASGIVSYNVKDVHPHDAAGIYDREGIALRAGQHCSQPAMRHLLQQATLRASVAFYNTETEVERFVDASRKARDFLDVLF